MSEKPIFTEDDLPSHLSVITELDFAKDLKSDPLASQWFRLGAWTISSSKRKGNIADVVSRQALLISPEDFENLYPSLDAIGNCIDHLGKPGGVQSYGENGPQYRYNPFYQFELRAGIKGEPLVFVGDASRTPKFMINPDILLLFELEEREGEKGTWWDNSASTEVIRQELIEDGNCEIVVIRTSYLLKYLRSRQKALLVGHYRHLHLYAPTQEMVDKFIQEDLTIGTPEKGAKAIFNNWGYRKDFDEPFLQRRLHLWFQITPPPLDLNDPWADKPPFDPYTFMLTTHEGQVAPARWKHFSNKDYKKFQGAPGNFLQEVYFKQEVLSKYENTVGFSVEDDGSVTCKHYWALNRSTRRHGNELLSTYIGDFAEGIPFEEWQHWKQFEAEYPSVDAIRTIGQERTIPYAVNNLVRMLSNLNSAMRALSRAQNLQSDFKLWNGSLDSLAGKLIKFVYPNNADEEEFIKRSTLVSTLVIDELSVEFLRLILNTFGADLHKSFFGNSNLGSRKLLQRLILVLAITKQVKPDPAKVSEYVKIAEDPQQTIPSDVDAELVLELKGIYKEIFDLFSPLALLYDLRIYGGLAHPPSMEKARGTAVQLGLPANGWQRRHFLDLVFKMSECIYSVYVIANDCIETIYEARSSE